MNAGRMDRLISIRQNVVSTSRSTDGQPLKTESTILANIWAEKRPLSMKELFSPGDRRRFMEADTQFTIRYTTVAINQLMFVYSDGGSYDIESVIDVGDRHIDIQILAKKSE